MFKAATEIVHDRLEEMCDKVRVGMHHNVEAVFTAMHRDYRTLVGDVGAQGLTFMPKWERDMRAETGKALTESEALFAAVLGQEMEEAGAGPDVNHELGHEDETVVMAEDLPGLAKESGVYERFGDTELTAGSGVYERYGEHKCGKEYL